MNGNSRNKQLPARLPGVVFFFHKKQNTITINTFGLVVKDKVDIVNNNRNINMNEKELLVQDKIIK